jgi:predicted MFS family arabinose efflux permease
VADSSSTSAAPAAAVGWRPYSLYVLAVLVLVNTSNYLDRGIVAILQQPMKDELGLTDWQLGMISGPAFALLYSAAGLPIARWAERGNRVTILGLALGFWSLMTAACGFAQNYLHLLISRLGVGAGEGACTPTTHSLISDYFSPRQRGLAMAVLTTSIPLGQLIAPLLGGFIAQTWGWRTAFMSVGLPGLLIALLLFLTVREPRLKKTAEERALVPRRPFVGDLRELFSTRSFLFLFIASAFLGQAITSTNSFTASFFIREHGLSLKEAGLVTAAGLGLAGLLGTFLGGFLADRFAGQYGRSYPLVCALGAGLASALFLVAYRVGDWRIAVGFLLVANVATDLKNGPNFAAAQNMASPQMRATAAAVLMFGAIVLGGGVGPVIVGAVSDWAAAGAFPTALGAYAETCLAGRGVAGAASGLSEACSAASATGLRTGLMAPCVCYLLASIFFTLSGLSIKRKLVD